MDVGVKFVHERGLIMKEHCLFVRLHGCGG